MARTRTYAPDRYSGTGGLWIDFKLPDDARTQISDLLKKKVPPEKVDSFLDQLNHICGIYQNVIIDPDLPDRERIINELESFNTISGQFIEHVSKWHVQSEEFLQQQHLIKYKREAQLKYVAIELKLMSHAVIKALVELKGSAGRKKNREVFLGNELCELFKTHLNGYYKPSAGTSSLLPKVLKVILTNIGSDKDPHTIAKAALKRSKN
ncbi:MAG: hypothetical protein GY746_10460 [Gammaproteobacteria bacterium]|nr:hypothetical protein [Gammaproteobacteria bacterium]